MKPVGAHGCAPKVENAVLIQINPLNPPFTKGGKGDLVPKSSRPFLMSFLP